MRVRSCSYKIWFNVIFRYSSRSIFLSSATVLQGIQVGAHAIIEPPSQVLKERHDYGLLVLRLQRATILRNLLSLALALYIRISCVTRLTTNKSSDRFIFGRVHKVLTSRKQSRTFSAPAWTEAATRDPLTFRLKQAVAVLSGVTPRLHRSLQIGTPALLSFSPFQIGRQAVQEGRLGWCVDSHTILP
jgi:hypothetical protein